MIKMYIVNSSHTGEYDLYTDFLSAHEDFDNRLNENRFNCDFVPEDDVVSLFEFTSYQLEDWIQADVEEYGGVMGIDDIFHDIESYIKPTKKSFWVIDKEATSELEEDSPYSYMLKEEVKKIEK